MRTDPSRSFGELLKGHRLAAGLSQEDLAERAGLSPRGVSDLERGARTNPRPATVRLLADALHLAETDRAAFFAAARRPRTDTHVDVPPTEPPALGASSLEMQSSGDHTFLLSDSAGSARVPRQLGNYRLIRLLGWGTYAEVYLAEHLHLETPVAVKVLLHTHLTAQEREWLRAEARTLARLLHPHIVRVLDFDVVDDVPFLVMEFAPNGRFLQRYPEGIRLPLEDIVAYTKQVAGALQYAHERGVIHCAVRPSNLVFGQHQEVLLADFGLAIRAQSAHSRSSADSPQQTYDTDWGLAYVAPEQIQGHPGPASDQYALGVMVYEWLVGEAPFSGPPAEIARLQSSAPPPSLRAKVPTLSPAIEQVVLRALAKDPALRFASVQTFAMALEEASRAATVDREGRAEPPGPTGVVSSAGSATVGDRGPPGPSRPDLPSGTVTLLFTDIEYSTRIQEQLGAAYAPALAACRSLLRAAFQRWSGHEVDTQGDAFFVAFARASDAVAAAVEAQRVLASHPWPDGAALRVRMGLHTGEPSLTGEGYIGLDVVRAARIMSAGHGGQVLLSKTTGDLVELDLPDDVSLRDLGEYRLKDLGRARRLFQVVIADLSSEFPPLKTLDTHPTNLPVQSTPFIGREQELAALQHLLGREDVRLLTLTGPGGAGKTRLGLQVAAELSDHFGDGTFFIDLAALSDSSAVMPTIAQTLGVREVRGQTPLERLAEEVRHKQLLLLLDNFEQVVTAAAQVVSLLAACPRLKVVVTSREVLHVQAEHEFVVPPLALPDAKHLSDLAALSHCAAVALFIQRAQAIKPDFQLTEANAGAVAKICARLDGLPLAIELAAAWMKLLPPQALLGRLGQRLTVLTSGARDVPIRQQTLRNTITWSYDLLTSEEQRLFRRLAVFVGGCTLDAIEAVCAVRGPDGTDGITALPVLDEVASLIDKSLLHQTEQEDGQPRVVMLETVRDYALDQLAASGEGEQLRRAHADFFLALAEHVEPWLIGGPRLREALGLVEREYDNLRAALSWALERGKATLGLRLAGALLRFWSQRWQLSEGRHWLEDLLALQEAGGTAADKASAHSDEDAVPQSVRAKALFGVGELAAFQGDFSQAESFLEESVALAQEMGDVRLSALALDRLGGVGMVQGDLRRATAYFETSMAIARRVGDPLLIVMPLENLGEAAYHQGDLGRAATLFKEAVEMDQQAEDYLWLAHDFTWLANTRRRQGDLRQAFTLLREAFAVLHHVGERAWPIELEGLAAAVAAAGRGEVAAQLLGAAAARRETLGAPLPPVQRADVEQAVAPVRAALGEERWAAAFAAGRAASLEEAIADALCADVAPGHEE